MYLYGTLRDTYEHGTTSLACTKIKSSSKHLYSKVQSIVRFNQSPKIHFKMYRDNDKIHSNKCQMIVNHSEITYRTPQPALLAGSECAQRVAAEPPGEARGEARGEAAGG